MRVAFFILLMGLAGWIIAAADLGVPGFVVLFIGLGAGAYL